MHQQGFIPPPPHLQLFLLSFAFPFPPSPSLFPFSGGWNNLAVFPAFLRVGAGAALPGSLGHGGGTSFAFRPGRAGERI